MKKNIIIHIGLAKTATTTLQRGLFGPLHNIGCVNYIGKTFKWKNELNDIEKNEQAYQSIMDYVVYNKKPIYNSEEIIDDNRINVFSEEMLSSTLFWQMKKSIPSDPKDYPQRLADYFSNYSDQITVLLTLRNPITHIYSTYTQSYRYFYNENKINTIHKFIDYLSNNKHLFLNFHYDQLVESWSKVFKPENIRILFFEDFINNKVYYYQQLSDLLNIPQNTIEQIIADAHFNQKKKDSKGYFNRCPRKNFYTNRIYSFLKKTIIYSMYLSLKAKYPNNILTQINNHLNIKSIQIPYLNEKQRLMIKNEFTNSNLRLAEKFKLDLEFLNKNNYI